MKYKSCTDYWLNTDNMTLRGEFEEMYRDVDDPWGCQKSFDSLNNRVFIELLFYNRKFERILDIGCGLGGFTNCLFKKNENVEIIGCDTSPIAILKASGSYPQIKFIEKNIQTEEICNLGFFDLIVLSEVIWYILDDIGGVFAKISKSLSRTGIVGIHQYFPDNQRFGNNVINGIAGFEEFIKNKTDLNISSKVVSYNEDGKVLLASMERKK